MKYTPTKHEDWFDTYFEDNSVSDKTKDEDEDVSDEIETRNIDKHLTQLEKELNDE